MIRKYCIPVGAATAHLLKYTKAYNEMYPFASQILVRSDPSFFWSSERTLVCDKICAVLFHVLRRIVFYLGSELDPIA